MTNGCWSKVQVGIITKMNKGKEKEKMLNVVIKDIDFNESYYLKLSEEQFRLLEWLNKKGILTEVIIEIFEGHDFEEI